MRPPASDHLVHALLVWPLGLLLTTLPAAADVAFRTQTTDSLRPSAQLRGDIWVDDTSLRMEFASRDAPGRTSVVIFRSDRSLYWTLDAPSRSYVEIDRAALEQLGERVRQARAEMRARLETLPPEQREKVETMLGEMLALETSAAAEEKLVPTESREEIDGVPTRRYDLVLQSEVVGAVWVAEWSALGVSKSDLVVFERLAEFQREMMRSLSSTAGAAFGSQPLEIFDRVEGFPLRIRRLQGGRTVSETRFSDVRKLPAQADRFLVPPDYTRRAGPGEAPTAPVAPPVGR